VTRVEFDRANPPKEPPRGVDPLLWRLSYQVWTDHQPAADRFCQAGTCRLAFCLWPCPKHRLATVGLLAAAGTRAPWASLNRSGHFR
jgi:hypothetical protein